jgi:hypothetical protein
MKVLYLFLNRPTTRSSDDGPSVPDEPLAEIRQGAFARWMADVKAQAERTDLATNEGIAAGRRDNAPAPG